MSYRGPYDFFQGGTWNFNCDVCARKLKASLAMKRWDGFMVCYECWEPRQPQDFVRGIRDDQGVPWSRDPGDPQFITTDVTPNDL